MENQNENLPVISSKVAELKREVQKLNTEISMLLLERDELRFVVCRNIETAYMLSLGALEFKAYELYCKVLRLKRKLAIITAKKNRQEKIDLDRIEKTLDEEFAEYKKQLDEQVKKMNEAIEYSKLERLTEEEEKEFKKLYRQIVKALHPDLNPNVTENEIKLFQNAVEAYKNGDLKTLRFISTLISSVSPDEPKENILEHLQRERERLENIIGQINEQISKIKTEYPYTLKEFTESSQKREARKAEIEETIEQLKAAYQYYIDEINESLR